MSEEERMQRVPERKAMDLMHFIERVIYGTPRA
jgi:hypothetical protein